MNIQHVSRVQRESVLGRLPNVTKEVCKNTVYIYKYVNVIKNTWMKVHCTKYICTTQNTYTGLPSQPVTVRGSKVNYILWEAIKLSANSSIYFKWRKMEWKIIFNKQEKIAPTQFGGCGSLVHSLHIIGEVEQSNSLTWRNINFLRDCKTMGN